jgi:hypothetical protein
MLTTDTAAAALEARAAEDEAITHGCPEYEAPFVGTMRRALAHALRNGGGCCDGHVYGPAPCCICHGRGLDPEALRLLAALGVRDE